MANEGEVRKGMEMMSHTWVANNCSVGKTLQLGECFRSDVFTSPSGNESFRIYCYPRGKRQRDYIDGTMCMRLENVGANEVQIVYSMEIINQLTLGKLANLRSSLFDQRIVYRHVVTIEPGRGCEVHCLPQIMIYGDQFAFTLCDRMKVRYTIGIFKNEPVAEMPREVPRSMDRVIFIKVKDNVRFYAEESVLQERCPKLVPENFSEDVLLPHIEGDTFTAVLWFIYHNKLERYDRFAISCSNTRDPDSVGMKMLAAARELDLQHLRRLIEALFRYNTTFIVELRAWRWKGFRNSSVEANKMIVTKTNSTTDARADANANRNNQG